MTRRSWGTAALLVLGWFAVVATTSTPAVVEGGEATGFVRLGPDNPELRVPFELAVNATAHQGSVQVDASFTYEWLSAEVPLTAAWHTPTGSTTTTDSLPPCRSNCIGESALVVRWPLEQEGSVLVGWKLEAKAEFDNLEPPEGVEISFTVDAPADHPGQRELINVIDLDNPVNGVAVTLDQVTPDVEGFLVGLPSAPEGVATFQLEARTTVEPLSSGRSIVLMRDDICDEVTCRFDLWAEPAADISPGLAPTPSVTAIPSGGFQLLVSPHSVPAVATTPIEVELDVGRDSKQEIRLEIPWNDAYLTLPAPVFVVDVAHTGRISSDDGFSLEAGANRIRLRGNESEPSGSLFVPLDCSDSISCRGTVMVTGKVRVASSVIQLTGEGAVHHRGLSEPGTIRLQATVQP